MTSAVGLFAPLGNRTAKLVSAELELLAPGATHYFDITLGDDSPTNSASISNGGVNWGGVDLTTLATGAIFGFHHEDPTLPSTDDDVDWSLWQAGHVVSQQKQSFLLSLFRRLTAKSVRLYNPPATHERAFAKLSHLQALEHAGLTLPTLTMTNEHETAQAIVDQAIVDKAEGAVWRPCTGRGAWQLFRDRQCADLVAADRPPILLASITSGRLIRSWVVDGHVVLAVSHQSPGLQGAELHKLEHLEFFTTEDVSPWADTLAQAAAALEARWCMLLFVLPDNGPPVFYDVDCDPILDGLPVAVAQRLAYALALALLGRESDIPALPPLPPAIPHERPALFQRRMLQILFDIEATKHRPD